MVTFLNTLQELKKPVKYIKFTENWISVSISAFISFASHYKKITEIASVPFLIPLLLIQNVPVKIRYIQYNKYVCSAGKL